VKRRLHKFLCLAVDDPIEVFRRTPADPTGEWRPATIRKLTTRHGIAWIVTDVGTIRLDDRQSWRHG
jgi:hypothetical protein